MINPSASPTAKRLVSIAEAAIYCTCHPNTLRPRISCGDLTGYRMGPRLLRVDLNELDCLLRPIPTAGAAS